MIDCTRFIAAAVAFALAAFALPLPVVADTHAAIEADVLAGEHFEGGTTRDDLIGLPLPIVRVQSGGPALDGTLELLPPVSFRYAGRSHTTSLSYLDLDLGLRVYHTLRLLGGMTVYNQSTSRTAQPGPIVQFSRVTGPALGLGADVGVARISFLVNSGMRGVQYIATPTSAGTTTTTALPERAEQIDASIRVRLKGGCAYAGARYLNYASRFDQPGAPLSDRNAGGGILYGMFVGCRRVR